MPTLTSRRAPERGTARVPGGAVSRRARVLVLDGQTNQALACVRSLGRAGYDVPVASDRRWPLGAWSRHCKGQFRVTGETVAAFAELRAWAGRQGVSVVLPLTERSCILCDADRAAWTEVGITVGCAPAETLPQAFDKGRVIARAEACRAAVPSTQFPDSLAACGAGVERPREGAIARRRRAPSTAHRGERPVLGVAGARERRRRRLPAAMDPDARRRGRDRPAGLSGRRGGAVALGRREAFLPYPPWSAPRLPGAVPGPRAGGVGAVRPAASRYPQRDLGPARPLAGRGGMGGRAPRTRGPDHLRCQPPPRHSSRSSCRAAMKRSTSAAASSRSWTAITRRTGWRCWSWTAGATTARARSSPHTPHATPRCA